MITTCNTWIIVIVVTNENKKKKKEWFNFEREKNLTSTRYKRGGKFLKILRRDKSCFLGAKANAKRIRSNEESNRFKPKLEMQARLIVSFDLVFESFRSNSIARKFPQSIQSVEKKRKTHLIPLLCCHPPLLLMFHFHKGSLRNMAEERGWEISKLSLISSCCFHGRCYFQN